MAMIGTMIGLGTAVDLFNLWVWFEAMAISSYMLVAFYREERLPLEAGVKYLVQSAVGSVLILMGIVVVFMYTRNLESGCVPHVPDALAWFDWGRCLFIIGFGVKTALVPTAWLQTPTHASTQRYQRHAFGVVIETLA